MKNVSVYVWAFLDIALAVILVVTFFVFRGTPNEPIQTAVPPLLQATTTLPEIVASPQSSSTPPVIPTARSPLFHYIEIVDGCGPYYDTGVCVNMRSGPGTEFPVVARLRTGVILKVEEFKAEALDGTTWYKVAHDGWIRYPERVVGDWYIAESEYVRWFEDIGDQWVPVGTIASTTKRIVVNLSEGMLYAYDGEELFMKEPTSPGLELTPTPRGSFTIYYKTPSRYMQGPIPDISEQEYDLPGVPFNLYFTPDGAVIHGAYWHDHFGKNWSHGCVNLSPENAKKLYYWAEVGMPVLVRD